jgi:hypothetical protein
MAKTDSFFIRKAIEINANGSGAGDFSQVSIDLGAYVDALGKAVLRIHNIAVQYSDTNGYTPDMTASLAGAIDFQLTTQTQSDIVVLGDNKSVVASGRLLGYRAIGSDGVPTNLADEFDMAPQRWNQGYLIGVEQMYLGGKTTTTGWAEDVVVSVVMECTSETLSKEAAMALALSQQ